MRSLNETFYLVYYVLMDRSCESYPAPSDEVFLPIHGDYAVFDEGETDRLIRLKNSFDWLGILRHLGVPDGKHVFLYAFRSIGNPDADPELLDALDVRALLAANESGGLIHYQPFEGLSFCIWESIADARAATSSPEHREAARYASEAYLTHDLQCWKIAVSTTTGEVEFSEPGPEDMT